MKGLQQLECHASLYRLWFNFFVGLVERLCRSVKYEEVYSQVYDTVEEAR
jgi:hypothetical protein